MDPIFLSVDDVIEIHRNQIELYGGDMGIRSVELLESAVAMPCATFGGVFLHPNIHEQAAAYLYHLVMNHPFVDGNKRVGAAAMVVFLLWNGYRLNLQPGELADFVLALASGERDKAEAAVFLKQNSARRAQNP